MRALTLSFTAAASFGPAASAAESPPPPVQLSPVVVQGRDTDLIGEATSSSQGIVGATELEARPFLRRGELLEVIPGVVITQHSGGGKANQYFMRGFNLDHGTDFSLSVDGLPVNMRSHAHGQGYADINFVIPELVQQVDYNKGPFFAAVGDFSAAGAAEFKLFDALPRGLAKLELGDDEHVRGVVAGTLKAGPGEATYGLELAHDAGPWVLDENFDRLNAFFRYRWATSAAEYRLTAMGYTAEWDATDQIPLRAVEAGTLDRFGYVDPTNGGKTSRASLAFDATVRGSAGTTRLNLYALAYRLNLFSNFTYFLDDPVDGDQFNQRDRRTVLGGALTHAWDTAAIGQKTDLTVGLQVRDDLIDELGLYRTSARERVSTVRNDDVNEASAGLFAQALTKWSDVVRTTAGIRLDGYRFKVDSDLAANSGQREAAIGTPKVGLVLGPWAKTEFYVNAGYGFHSNDARGTTIRVDPADGVTPADRVNPLVRSRGAEIGLRTSAVPGLVSSVTFWGLDLDSELVFVGDAGGTEATGRTRRYGVELANFYRPLPWLVLDGDVSFTHGRYRDDPGADRIANSIDTVVTGGVSVENKAGWFGAVRLRYFGPQPLIEDNSIRAPSSTTFNGRLGWKNEDWEIAVEVLNLFDRKNNDIAYAYTSRLPGEPADGIDDLHFHPAEPRAFRVSLARRF